MNVNDIASYYNESQNFLQARKQRQVQQLVLLCNLNKGDMNIASSLLITLFNRVMSSVYDDKMQVKFLPSQGIMQEQLNAYNILAQSDYIEMDKEKIDYDWIWDTLFFGRGYCETLKFNKNRKIMEPAVINPLMFGYDPYVETPKEWRYYWKWVTKTKWELQKYIDKGVITGIKNPSEIMSGIDPYIYDYKIKRDQAMKGVEPAGDTVNGDIFQILEFFGYNDKGNKAVFWTDRGFSKLLMEEELNLDEGTEIIDQKGDVIFKDSDWPIVVKEAFRIPHASIPFSVSDLLDDKHRAKSVLLNLAFIAAKDKANPLYGYNPDKVRDVTQFFNRQINQHIPMEDETAAWPLNTQDPMSAGLIQFISMLTTEANDPVGTGLVGQPSQDRGSDTATEAAITQQMNDMAQSLLSKVLQFGEKEFWSKWFHHYQKHAPQLKTKMANIVGVKGVETQEIDLKMFDTDFPPGVYVYSAKEAQYKELVKRRDFMQLYPQLLQTLDPDGMRNFNKHVFFPLFLEDPSLIDVILPKTTEEIKAEEQNEMLKNEQLPPVLETDDHQTHLYMHRMVQPKTWATWIHMQEHEEALAKQRAQEAQMALAEQSTQGSVNVGAQKRSPMEASSPLKAEINPSPNAV